jgi:hypothetical protein
MSRSQTSQRQRTQDNPLNLGTFDRISLRHLRGSLGPQNKVIGYRDTNQNSNGGFGGGEYNHWFKIGLSVNAWLILIKGQPRPNYINVSAYEMDLTPMEGRAIFQEDSVSQITDGHTDHPYTGHVMNAQSNLYNVFAPNRLDLGDDRYYPLGPGNYLICVSTTRNEPLDYEVGLVVDVEDPEGFLQTEVGGPNFLVYENAIDLSNTLVIGPTFNINYTITTGFNAYTNILATIVSSVTVTVPETSTWFIDNDTVTASEDIIMLDMTENYTGQDIHLHSLYEWQEAWERDHQQDDRFPDIYLPLITTS